MPEAYDIRGKKIWIAGHTGLVGSALMRRLSREQVQVLTVPSSRVDLRRQSDVEEWMQETRPDVVLLAAARVGGIGANSQYPADFLYDNLAIAQNVIHQAYTQKVEKLVFLGSSCIYPKYAPQPIAENSLLSGALEPTNEAYAIAKIAGLKLCEFYRKQYGCDFISLMPCNLYGPGDRWHDAGAHVIPGLISRFHEAKAANFDQVIVWGSGKPMREFLYVDDLADAVVMTLERYSAGDPLNVGSGQEIMIRDLARMIAATVGYEGTLVFDDTKPDGTPRKVLDTSRLKGLGWDGPLMSLEKGLAAAYNDFLESSNVSRISSVS